MEEYVDEYDLRIIEKVKSDIALNCLKNGGIPRQVIIKCCGLTEQWLQELEMRLKEGPAAG
ncbi:MAG: hypothetical protein LBW85_06940 [Deltaproteobacteria bacterium]|jgi:hypothetical protein|nr:hypothetical protein [Deltaproteobacteria bacterium]